MNADLGTLAADIRGRLGPVPEPAEPPLVSVVVVNRDGVEHLQRLLAGLVEHTDYPRLELILVDNGSSDGSLDLARSAEVPFPVSIVANRHNESFSDANNQGRARARGELLLFLNNDIEPFESGWLRELVACLQDGGDRAVGATLLFPHEDRDRFPDGYAVQYRGLRFRDEAGRIAPALHDWEADPFDARFGEDAESPAVIAACLLVEAAAFDDVGGFTHGYLYGAEDVDLCLKLRATGTQVICSGRSLLIHRPGSTRRQIVFEEARERKLRNHRLLGEHWGPLLRRHHDLDALAGGGMWVQAGREGGARAASTAEVEAPGICIRASDPPPLGAGEDPVEELRASAAAGGRRCLVLRGEEVDDPRGLEYDIAIHVAGRRRYLPAPGQLNVLWELGGANRSDHDRSAYDLTLSGDPAAILDAALAAAPRPLPACAS